MFLSSSDIILGHLRLQEFDWGEVVNYSKKALNKKNTESENICIVVDVEVSLQETPTLDDMKVMKMSYWMVYELLGAKSEESLQEKWENLRYLKLHSPTSDNM